MTEKTITIVRFVSAPCTSWPQDKFYIDKPEPNFREIRSDFYNSFLTLIRLTGRFQYMRWFRKKGEFPNRI